MLRLLAALGLTVAFVASSCSGGGGAAETTTGPERAAATQPAQTDVDVLPPSNFTAKAASFKVALRWTPPPGAADGYALFRDGAAIGATVRGSITTFTDARGIVPNREYVYEIETRVGDEVSDRVSATAETVEPPVKAARLEGTFNVRARNVSTTGFDEWDVPTYGWFFHPLCQEGACDVRFGDLHQKRVRAKLARAGGHYRGSYSGQFGVACEGTPAPSTVTIALEVVAARAIGEEWRATRAEGTLTITQAAQLGCGSGQVKQELHLRFLR